MIDKLDKLPARGGRRAARRARPARPRSRPGAAWSWRPSACPTPRSWSGSAPSASRTSSSRPASPSSRPWSRAARSATGDRVTRRGQPAHRARARLLHRHRARDLHGRLRAPEVGRRGRSLRRARRRRPHHLPGRRASPSASPARSSRCSPTASCGGSRSVPSAVLVALADEESRPDEQRRRRRPARPRHAVRGRGRPQKFGKQIRYAERRGIPFVWFTAADGTHEVKDIRSGDQVRGRPGRLDAPHRGPATAGDLDQPRGEHVIRTHDAGALRAEHVDQTVTLAGWVARRRDHGGVAFLDLREASGVVQVVSATRRSRTACAASSASRSPARSALRPQGNANPNLPSGEIEVIADRRASRCSARPRRCRSRSTSHVGGGGGGPPQAPLPRPAPHRPEPAALRLRSKVNKAARDVLDGTASSRSRPRR